jgi:hypothetical protein
MARETGQFFGTIFRKDHEAPSVQKLWELKTVQSVMTIKSYLIKTGSTDFIQLVRRHWGPPASSTARYFRLSSTTGKPIFIPIDLVLWLHILSYVSHLIYCAPSSRCRHYHKFLTASSFSPAPGPVQPYFVSQNPRSLEEDKDYPPLVRTSPASGLTTVIKWI